MISFQIGYYQSKILLMGVVCGVCQMWIADNWFNWWNRKGGEERDKSKTVWIQIDNSSTISDDHIWEYCENL